MSAQTLVLAATIALSFLVRTGEAGRRCPIAPLGCYGTRRDEDIDALARHCL